MSEAAIPKPKPFVKPTVDIVDEVALAFTGKKDDIPDLDPSGSKKEPKKPAEEKKPFVLQPRMTNRPFKGHPGLEDLKKHLGRKK